uniref:Uncharacterized protein n=1 Tax=Ciona savignyi TaxID=51511 RepID=H2Y9M5_CIOSA
MAADVMRMDPTAIDADGETSGTETHFAGKRGSGSSETMSESVDVVSAKKNHHHRRKPSKKKRKWKPYSKMTWEEKREAEEREQLRADRIRCEMIKRGRPVAPYNTTQFIMAEHDTYEGDSLDQKDQGGSVFSTSGGHSVVNQTESPANTD